MSKCQTCQHWELKNSPLRRIGFGQCKTLTDPWLYAATTFSAYNQCRYGKHVQTDAQTIAARVKADK